MERNHEDDGPTYALSAGAKRIEPGLVLIDGLGVTKLPVWSASRKPFPAVISKTMSPERIPRHKLGHRTVPNSHGYSRGSGAWNLLGMV
jgi:hypothetical protein